MAYITCFIVSTFIAYLAKQSRNKYSFIVCSIISLLITIVLATLRDYSIGVDTYSYLRLNYYWQGASSFNSLHEYLKYYLEAGNSEPLFALFMGVIAQLTDEYRVFLFMAQAVTMVGVYIGAYRMKEHSDPVLTLLLFYLLYYNYTLNATRQYMALAILFAAVHDIEEGKYKRYIIFVLIAALIHNTSILGLPLLVLYHMIYGKEKKEQRDIDDLVEKPKKVSVIRRVVIGGLIIGVFYYFKPISHALINYGILNSKYLIYLNSESNASFLASRMFLLVEIICLVLTLKTFRKNNVHPDFFVFCSIAFLLLFQLSTAIRTGARIARFFSVINISTIGMMVHCQRGQKKILFGILVIMIAFAFWFYTYAYTNYSHTFPYMLGV